MGIRIIREYGQILDGRKRRLDYLALRGKTIHPLSFNGARFFMTNSANDMVLILNKVPKLPSLFLYDTLIGNLRVV